MQVIINIGNNMIKINIRTIANEQRNKEERNVNTNLVFVFQLNRKN